jgi:hypothetical protein
LAFVFAWSGEAIASLPTQPIQSTLSSDDGAVAVARRKKRKKRKKKKKKKRGGAAVAPAPPEPPPEPPPADTGGESGAATEGDAKAKDADWGSSDWASPDWAGGGGGGSSSSDLLKEESGDTGSSDDKPVEEVKKDAKPSKSYRKKSGVAGAFVLFSPVYTGVNRSFSYSPAGNTSDNLRPYEASYVSMAGAKLEFYPGVLLGVPYLDKVGIRGGYRMALGLKSAARTEPGTEYGTNWNEIDADLAGRFAFGDAILTIGAGIGMLNFELDVPGSDPLSDQVQDLGYMFIRAGIDFRYSIDKLSILLGGAYRHVLSTGELGDSVFPDSSAMGFDASAGVAFQLLDFVEAFASFQFTQFMHSLEANATYDADGATDRYLGGQAGITLFF